MGVDADLGQLTALYAAMSDKELLHLLERREGLTPLAQQALAVEQARRGLALPEVEQEAPPIELAAAGDDPSQVLLWTFQIVAEAEAGLRWLDQADIPAQIQNARRRQTEDGPEVTMPWVEVYVPRARQAEAVALLRQKMGLFPLAEKPAESLRVDGAAGSSDEEMFTVGDFDVQADAERASAALTDAGIPFREERQQDSDGQIVSLLVHFDDMERASEAVEAAFA